MCLFEKTLGGVSSLECTSSREEPRDVACHELTKGCQKLTTYYLRPNTVNLGQDCDWSNLIGHWCASGFGSGKDFSFHEPRREAERIAMNHTNQQRNEVIRQGLQFKSSNAIGPRSSVPPQATNHLFPGHQIF